MKTPAEFEAMLLDYAAKRQLGKEAPLIFLSVVDAYRELHEDAQRMREALESVNDSNDVTPRLLEELKSRIETGYAKNWEYVDFPVAAVAWLVSALTAVQSALAPAGEGEDACPSEESNDGQHSYYNGYCRHCAATYTPPGDAELIVEAVNEYNGQRFVLDPRTVVVLEDKP
jgi:hypothetical protein